MEKKDFNYIVYALLGIFVLYLFVKYVFPYLVSLVALGASFSFFALFAVLPIFPELFIIPVIIFLFYKHRSKK